MNLEVWRAEKPTPRIEVPTVEIDGRLVIKEERLPSGQIGHDMIS